MAGKAEPPLAAVGAIVPLELAPGIAHVPFELAPGLTYGCAFETAAGSVEVEAVGGTNAALLAIDRLVTP